MVWWPLKGNSTDSQPEDIDKIEKKYPVFLEDVPPKFQDEQLLEAENAKKMHDAKLPPEGQQYSTAGEVNRYLKSLSWDNFQFSNLIQIPCFRDAGLSGFSCMFVFSTVLFLYHRDLRKSLNWGYGGLLLGSVFGWEHCNRIRRNGEKVVQLAQHRYQENQKKKNEGKKN
ncbi:hypothetical protein FOA43_004112 [Brettanomyces nanus]|uniref:Cytochrome c oxidase assembly protein COX20, mitochondrial n=1 Tax=Eeniella nana TaxID=13502 RepID=A0A875S6Z3_EENNA|nr:uncharacterized protein FOA43_004112 [Brettanomyces nanus]QPG76718.1 hypothetical protein FOA43_004112 [Brettanomyces nanus]